MEFANFKLLDTRDRRSKSWPEVVVSRDYIGSVDVTTGRWFWRKTETRKIGKRSVFWRWLDTGEFIPNELERLIEVWSIENNKDLS